MKSKQSKIIALFTSFLVLAVGAVVSGLLYYYGIFSAWVALFSTVGASAFYLKCCNKKDAIYYLWMLVFAIGLKIAALCLSLIIQYQTTYGVPFDVASAAFGEIVTENLNGFIINVVFTVAFCILGIAIFKLFNKTKKEKKSDKQEDIEKINTAQPETVGDEYIKIADFCLKNYVQFLNIQDAKEREKKIGEFNQKFLAKFTAEIKQKVLMALSQKKLSDEQLKAFALLKTYMK